MKLLDNYLDNYYLKKLLRETLDWLAVYRIDTKWEVEKLGNGRRVLSVYVKLKEENDEQYMIVSRASSSRAVALLPNEDYFKNIQKYTGKVLREKHERLGR